MKTLSMWLLRFAEYLYLKVHGWKPKKNYLCKNSYDWWDPPQEYVTKKGNEPHQRGHAINSQKWVNSNTHRVGVFHDGDSR